MKPKGIQALSDGASGYRGLQSIKRETDKAVLAVYYDWELWLPKKAVRKTRSGEYVAPSWAIDSAKDFIKMRNSRNA
jgi:hypothetical protein